MLSSSNIWERMLQKQAQNPEIFKKFEIDHDIKKLKLQKITAQDLPRKILNLKEMFSPPSDSITKNWLQNEYRVFIWFVVLLSEVIGILPKNFERNEWDLIASSFKKEPSDCRYFYLCTLKAKTEPWKSDEDRIIIQLMQNQTFYKKWTDIGLELFRKSEETYFRKPKTIRQRWSSHLNPDVNKSEWKNYEDLFMLKKIQQFGKRWSRISNLLGTRSQHSVKNRFNHILNQRCRITGESYRNISAKRQTEHIQAYITLLQKQINTVIKIEDNGIQSLNDQVECQHPVSTPAIKEECREPFIIGYVFHPIIITSLPQL